MFLFIRLILAHMIGDFPFQTNVIYKAKIAGFKGLIIHASIIGVLLSLLSWPFWQYWQIWVLIIFVSATHFLQDWLKILLIDKMQKPNHFCSFVLDQLFHVLFICTVFLTPLSNLRPQIQETSIFANWYTQDKIIILMIAYLFATYLGMYFIYTFKRTYLLARYQNNDLEPIQKIYGIIERALMLSILVFQSVLTYPFLLLFFVVKFFFANREIKKLKGKHFAPYMIDTAMGLIIVGIITLVLKAAYF